MRASALEPTARDPSYARALVAYWPRAACAQNAPHPKAAGPVQFVRGRLRSMSGAGRDLKARARLPPYCSPPRGGSLRSPRDPGLRPGIPNFSSN